MVAVLTVATVLSATGVTAFADGGANTTSNVSDTNQNVSDTDQKPDRSDTDQPDRSDTDQKPDSSGTNQKPDSSGTNQKPDSSGTNQKPDSSSTNQPSSNPGSSSSSSSSSSSAPASTPEQKPDATPDKNTTTEVKEDGSKVTTTVEEKEDGSKVTTVKTEGKNAFGKAVVKTEKITVDKNGNTSISETTEIKAAQKGVDVSVSVKKDGNGKVTSAKTTLTCTNQKVTISADTFSQIKEAAGTKKVKVTVKLGKNTKVSISGTDVKANTTLKVYKLDSKTGKYKVTKITVKIDKKGNIKMPKLGKGTFKVKSK